MTIYYRVLRTVKWVTGAALLLPLLAQADGLYWATEGPGTPDNGDGTRFSRTQISLTLPLEARGNRQESVQTSAHIDATEFSWEGTTAAQNDYYWLSLPLEYRQRRGRSSEFLIRAEPGLMTDLAAIDSDSLAVNLDLTGRLYQQGGSFWELGLTVNREFGDFNPRPVLSFAWKATRDTEALLGFPRTLIQTRWSDNLSTFVHIRPAGGVWQEEIQGLTGTYRVSYTNWKAGFGGEFHWRGPVWLSAELGQLRHRRIKATDDTDAGVSATPGEDTYWQAGLQLRY